MSFMRRVFLLIIFVEVAIFEARPQTYVLDINSIWSKDLLIQSAVDSFYEIMGVPDHIDSSHKCIVRFPMQDGIWFDTTLCYNLFYYFDQGLVYAEKDGFISLAAVEFFKNDTITIHTRKIDFNRETRVKEVVSVFHLKSRDVLKEPLKLLEYDSPYFYSMQLSTGFSPTDIKLIFDNKKKLLHVDILPVY